MFDAKEICSRILLGEKDAERLLYVHYLPRLTLILRRRAPQYDDMEIEDLVQETMIVVLKRLRTRELDEPSKLSGFLQRTAVNLYIGKVRREIGRQTTFMADLPDVPSEGENAAFETVVEEERTGLVRRLLSELPTERDREILMQHYVLTLDKVVVCENLGLTHQQFDRVVYNAKKRLRQLFQQHINLVHS